MNRFLATTALALLLGAAPALAQSPDAPSSPPQEPGMQAPMQPESPSAIPSEPAMKAPDQSSEATPILPDKSAKNLEQNAQFLNEQKADDILASTIIGKPAVNSQDESIGDVNDLVTDRSGKILAALIGVGGFLGIGEKDVAVHFEDLKLTRDESNNTKVVLNVSKETLASAPDYKTLDEQPVVEGSAKPNDTSRTY
ncbi:MAG TPA: PRC-barrel domain-containing protein [Methyloceanibacter sp.]|nr:PRC-barrel domain-containing protein [Methyloceanibacter sp.]